MYLYLFTDYNSYWSEFREKILKITALPDGCVAVAKFVFLRLTQVSGESPELIDAQLIEVERLLKFELKKLLFTKDSRIFMDFFNKQLILQVVSWRSFLEEPCAKRDEMSLTETFENLTLKCEAAPKFFEVTLATKINIERKKSTEIKENSSNMTSIKKIDIGGLDRQIEIIEEAMDTALGVKNVPACRK